MVNMVNVERGEQGAWHAVTGGDFGDRVARIVRVATTEGTDMSESTAVADVVELHADELSETVASLESMLAAKLAAGGADASKLSTGGMSVKLMRAQAAIRSTCEILADGFGEYVRTLPALPEDFKLAFGPITVPEPLDFSSKRGSDKDQLETWLSKVIPLGHEDYRWTVNHLGRNDQLQASITRKRGH